ncbi:MAG: nickel insertion protein, partial [Desulfotomaculaceae bacterium]
MTGKEEKVTVIETTIDDMNPEIYSYLLDKLIKDGALDAYAIPVYMKKNRPAN